MSKKLTDPSIARATNPVGLILYGVENENEDKYVEGGSANGVATLGLDSRLPQSQTPKTETVTTLAIASGVVTINFALGNMFKLTLSENVTSVVFQNLPATGLGQGVTILITQNASVAKTITGWPTGTKWFNGAYVASTGLSAVDEIGLTNYGGTTQVVGKYGKGAA